MKRKSTLRKLPPKTRKIAKELNNLELTVRRLTALLGDMAELEKTGKAWEVLQRMDPDSPKEKEEFVSQDNVMGARQIEALKRFQTAMDEILKHR